MIVTVAIVAMNGTAALVGGWFGLVSALRREYLWTAVFSGLCGANLAFVCRVLVN